MDDCDLAGLYGAWTVWCSVHQDTFMSRRLQYKYIIIIILFSAFPTALQPCAWFTGTRRAFQSREAHLEASSAEAAAELTGLERRLQASEEAGRKLEQQALQLQADRAALANATYPAQSPSRPGCGLMLRLISPLQHDDDGADNISFSLQPSPPPPLFALVRPSPHCDKVPPRPPPPPSPPPPRPRGGPAAGR